MPQKYGIPLERGSPFLDWTFICETVQVLFHNEVFRSKVPLDLGGCLNTWLGQSAAHGDLP